MSSTSAPRVPSFLRGPLFANLQATLTTLSAVFLVAAFVPGVEYLAYLSCLFGAYYAVKSTLESLRARELDVNFLMVLAAVGAVAIGEARDAAALLFLFGLSSTLESFAMARTKSAIESLVKLRPAQARRVSANGSVEMVAVEQLAIDDRIVVHGFEGVPADGEVADGASSVDESALTGEAAPIQKVVGSPVTGGTQNLEGTLTIRVLKTVGNSALDQIVALVQNAQDNKASGERLSTWFGQRYTVFVLVAFLVSWGVRLGLRQPPTDAFYQSLTLLVGLSPCALVISTPASTLSALANAAWNGILVRGGEFIEKAGEVTLVAMDKTGTLTKGKPRLVEMVVQPREGALQRWNPEQPLDPLVQKTLGEVAAIESFSAHPLALAVVRSAEGFPHPVGEGVETVPGMGLVGRCEGRAIAVGNDTLLTREGHPVPTEITEVLSSWKRAGRTVVLAATADYTAAFSFEDEIRPEAKAVIQELRDLGVRHIVVLTGDKAETAASVAATVGITEVHAGLLPGDKTEMVQKLAATDRVMMVGDGVNDAPSLASASVGVAMGGLGSDVALNAADVVLMHDRLDRIPQLIRLGRRTKRIITANLVLASGMILTLTIASFTGKLPLPIAVLGHEGSTVLVILNGLRLLRGK